MGKIYKLIDPRTNEIRYIGYTNKRISKRLKAHIRDSLKCNKTHKHHWIRSLLNKGLKPKIAIIKIVGDDWQKWEIYYIALYKAKGCNLVNGSDGGEGVLNPNKETRYKIGSGTRNKKLTPEHREKLSKAKQGKIGKECVNSKGLYAYKDNKEYFFHSAQEAENYIRSLGLKASKKNIGQCLTGKLVHGKYKRKHVAGFTFKRKNK
jgi:hypothetical protein